VVDQLAVNGVGHQRATMRMVPDWETINAVQSFRINSSVVAVFLG
jgi:hypothetical protein